MALVRNVQVNIRANPGDTKLKIDEITRRADEMGRLHPEIKVKIDTAAASAKLAVLKHELNSLSRTKIQTSGPNGIFGPIPAEWKRLLGNGSSSGGIGGIGGAAGGGAAGGAGGAGGGLLGGLIGAGAILSPPVIGAALGLTGFAAVAIPTIMKITKAQTALNTATAAYAKATTKAGRASALKAEQAATAGLSDSQLTLMHSIHGVETAFSKITTALGPMVAAALQPVLKLAKDLLPLLKPLAVAGAAIFDAFITPLDNLIRSPFFHRFALTMAGIGTEFAQLFGPELVSILKSVLGLIMNLAPSVMILWKALGPLVTLMVKEFAKVLAQILPPLIVAFAGVLKAITPLIPPLTKLFIQIFPPLIKLLARLTIDVLPAVVAVINKFVIPAIGFLITAVKAIMQPVTWVNDHWKQAWNDLWTWTKRIFGDLVQWIWNDFALKIINFFRHLWDTVWRDAKTIWGNIIGWFKGLPGTVGNALSSLPGILSRLGHSAMNGLWNGLKSIANNILSWLHSFLSKVTGGLLSAGGGSSGGTPGAGAPAANAALARRMIPAWSSGANWNAWNAVAMRESGWSQYARNASSGAYGIPQALPPTKMPFAAQAAGGSNPGAQIAWMAAYMSNRYGGPIGAEQHEQAFGWYDQGGWLPPGLSMALNTTGRPERVGDPGGNVIIQNLHVTAQDGPALLRSLQALAARQGALRLKVRS